MVNSVIEMIAGAVQVPRGLLTVVEHRGDL